VAIAPPWTTSPIVASRGDHGSRSSAWSRRRSTISIPSSFANGEAGTKERMISARVGWLIAAAS
jgi:hypothetical protein